MQAVDRAHRLGQTREVHVSKLVMTLPPEEGVPANNPRRGGPTKDPEGETVEERILVMQDRKRQIAEAALTDGRGAGQMRLSLQDLRVLFGLAERGPLP
jgi:SNF2 family DNA or RNA helicase